MKKNCKEYLDDLLGQLQQICEEYDFNFDCGASHAVVNGLIFGKDYKRYRQVIGSVEDKFTNLMKPLYSNLNDFNASLRENQPAIQDLSVAMANKGEVWPEGVALGNIEIGCGNSLLIVPNMIKFPLEKPVYQLEDNSIEKLHKLLLRILFACPMGKVQITAFDKDNYGDALGDFKTLLRLPEIFPQQKIITDQEEFREVLKDLNNDINNLLQREFPKYRGCKTWQDYNNIMLEQGKGNKCLPYRIVCYFGMLADDMTSECFTLFKRLANWGPRVGILPIFTFSQSDVLPDQRGNFDRNTQRLVDLRNMSLSLENLFSAMPDKVKAMSLAVNNIMEDFLPLYDMYDLLLEYGQELEKNRKPIVSFNELLGEAQRYSRNAKDGIFIPMGSNAQNGEVVEIRFGDVAKNASPHALIGGITGSGKSNLLHVIISSASWHYDPNELSIYLLDFKDGVEFSTYARNGLPNAKLVAVESDAEYGASVLKHLEDEKVRRNELFAKHQVKDYYNYRKFIENKLANGEYADVEFLPRILIIVDEFQRLLLGQGTFESLLLLAQQGRSAGMHMLLCAQSLQGLDFGQAEKQFQARIALKCKAEDSARLLGSYNNTEAVNLDIPYGILNTAGSEAFNVKFATPEAKPEDVELTVQRLCDEWSSNGFETDMKIFSGAKLPILPEDEYLYESYDELKLLLGESLDYDAGMFKIKLEKKSENNILFYGENVRMRNGLMASLGHFAEQSNDMLEEIVYIGYNRPVFEVDYVTVQYYEDSNAFLKEMSGDFFNKRRLVILDNCNLVSEIGFGGFSPSKDGKAFKEFMDNANKNGTFVMAFYESINAVNEMGTNFKKYFGHKVAFDKAISEIQSFLGMDVRINSKAKTEKRAVYCKGGKLAWFRPYVLELAEGEKE